MITLSILIVLALICALVGVLMGLFSLIGLLASLLVGVLVGALAGHIANRFMGTQTSTGRWVPASASGWITDCSTIVDRFLWLFVFALPSGRAFLFSAP